MTKLIIKNIVNFFNNEKDKIIHIDLNDKIGTVILNNIAIFKHAYMLKYNNKFFGYDYLFDKKFNDYLEFRNLDNIEVFDSSPLNWQYASKKLHFPIIYFQNNLAWPPAENWSDGDPINQAPFLIWNGFGNGPTMIEADLDNNYINLVILKYSNSVNKEIKKVINKFAYLKAILLNNKDPLTNQKLDSNFIKFITSCITFFSQPNDKPLLEIPMIFSN
ncbi:hypothetical protein CPAV1605_837 [seawater metagenome]|uniref:Uncharacterized protein n=1 Tax=seawater metagenome TaxID=1561972 RepID=A0A5E8CLX9_9ZZZZ